MDAILRVMKYFRVTNISVTTLVLGIGILFVALQNPVYQVIASATSTGETLSAEEIFEPSATSTMSGFEIDNSLAEDVLVARFSSLATTTSPENIATSTPEDFATSEEQSLSIDDTLTNATSSIEGGETNQQTNRKEELVFDVVYTTKGRVYRSSNAAEAKLRQGSVANPSEEVKQNIFLSPDRKHIAITESTSNYQTYTYIVDLRGKTIAGPATGSFVDWAPDNSKVILYLSIEQTGSDRRVYYLTLDNQYYDSHLPAGVTGAAISPEDGSIVYTLTDSHTDTTKVYVRNAQGKDSLLIADEGIYVWPRWSPDGKQIALLGSSGNKELLLLDPDTGNAENISSVQWNYPPVWSPNGESLLFVHSGSIYEFNLSSDSLETIFDSKVFVEHPVYAGDGETVLFSDREQIWSVQYNSVKQMTSGSGEKRYPSAL
jgi:WD40 repeat protein